jgi:type II secretory pathway pseudopilin PulG
VAEKAAAEKAAADKAAQDAAAKAAAEQAAAEAARQEAAAAEAARQQQAAAAAAQAQVPVRPAAPAAPAGCDTNYSGACVPIASDVDCAGGSGNGPAYVSGPVRVVGSDIYGLDRDGDGVGCEG